MLSILIILLFLYFVNYSAIHLPPIEDGRILADSPLNTVKSILKIALLYYNIIMKLLSIQKINKKRLVKPYFEIILLVFCLLFVFCGNSDLSSHLRPYH